MRSNKTHKNVEDTLVKTRTSDSAAKELDTKIRATKRPRMFIILWYQILKTISCCNKDTFPRNSGVAKTPWWQAWWHNFSKPFFSNLLSNTSRRHHGYKTDMARNIFFRWANDRRFVFRIVYLPLTFGTAKGKRDLKLCGEEISKRLQSSGGNFDDSLWKLRDLHKLEVNKFSISKTLLTIIKQIVNRSQPFHLL